MSCRQQRWRQVSYRINLCMYRKRLWMVSSVQFTTFWYSEKQSAVTVNHMNYFGIVCSLVTRRQLRIIFWSSLGLQRLMYVYCHCFITAIMGSSNRMMIVVNETQSSKTRYDTVWITRSMSLSPVGMYICTYI